MERTGERKERERERGREREGGREGGREREREREDKMAENGRAISLSVKFGTQAPAKVLFLIFPALARALFGQRSPARR